MITVFNHSVMLSLHYAELDFDKVCSYKTQTFSSSLNDLFLIPDEHFNDIPTYNREHISYQIKTIRDYLDHLALGSSENYLLESKFLMFYKT